MIEKIKSSSGWRKAVLEKLGGKCSRCGFSDPRALQIDHIKGDGCKEKAATGFKYYQQMYDHLEDYQILCANCNWIKRAENKESRKIKSINGLYIPWKTSKE